MTLTRGDRGPAVRSLQRRLAALGFDPGPADGGFGRQTLRALQAFQASHLDPRGRPLSVDGRPAP